MYTPRDAVCTNIRVLIVGPQTLPFEAHKPGAAVNSYYDGIALFPIQKPTRFFISGFAKKNLVKFSKVQ